MKIRIIHPIQNNPSIKRKIFNQFIFDLDFLHFIFNRKNKNYLLLKDKRLTIFTNEKTKEMDLAEISNLRIYFCSDGFVSHSDFLKYSKIEFNYQGKKHEYQISCFTRKYLKFCKKLYAQRFNFKEFYDEKRVFLGKKPNYQSIQKLKEIYRIDW